MVKKLTMQVLLRSGGPNKASITLRGNEDDARLTLDQLDGRLGPNVACQQVSAPQKEYQLRTWASLNRKANNKIPLIIRGQNVTVLKPKNDAMASWVVANLRHLARVRSWKGGDILQGAIQLVDVNQGKEIHHNGLPLRNRITAGEWIIALRKDLPLPRAGGVSLRRGFGENQNAAISMSNQGAAVSVKFDPRNCENRLWLDQWRQREADGPGRDVALANQPTQGGPTPDSRWQA